MYDGGDENVRLPFDLQQDEHILLLARRHWIFLWPRVIALCALAIFGVVLVWGLASWIVGLGSGVVLVLLVASIIWLGVLGMMAVLTWYRYWNDLWVVSNQRLIDSHKKHWFHHRLASADLVDVEDMMVEREGFLSTILNFGSVRCQTAGIAQNFVLVNIPRPTSVLTAVDTARDTARREARYYQ